MFHLVNTLLVQTVLIMVNCKSYSITWYLMDPTIQTHLLGMISLLTSTTKRLIVVLTPTKKQWLTTWIGCNPLLFWFRCLRATLSFGWCVFKAVLGGIGYHKRNPILLKYYVMSVQCPLAVHIVLFPYHGHTTHHHCSGFSSRFPVDLARWGSSNSR